MGSKGRWFCLAVIVGCALSIAGVRPMRWFEQLPAPVLDPLDRLRLDFVGRLVAAVLPSASFQAADRPYGHVLIAEDLATQPHIGQFACL